MEERIIIEQCDDIGKLDADPEKLLKTYGGSVLLYCEEKREVRILFFSNSAGIRAVEFLDFLVGEFALISGDARRSEAKISTTILKTGMTETEKESIADYLEERKERYFAETKCVIAEEYGRVHREEIIRMSCYQKKKVHWAVVKTLDIAGRGEQLLMKSLENEEGEVITADEETYIMIGCRGEIYRIERAKFEKTYEEKEEKLDIFAQMFDFIPEVRRLSDGQYISIDEEAKLCFPLPGKKIYATELKQRTKVFPKEGEYFLGHSGDYLVIRSDDLTDVYIVQRKVFEETYETV